MESKVVVINYGNVLYVDCDDRFWNFNTTHTAQNCFGFTHYYLQCIAWLQLMSGFILGRIKVCVQHCIIKVKI